METSNTLPPESDLSRPAVARVDTTGAFDPSGRFTRLSWLAWTLILSVLTVAVSVGLVALPEAPGEALAIDPAAVALVVVQLASFIANLIFAIRRLHDMAASGWWSSLLLVPLANLAVILTLALKRGTAGENRFGPPRATPGWEKILGIVCIAFVVLIVAGLIASVVVPTLMGPSQPA